MRREPSGYCEHCGKGARLQVVRVRGRDGERTKLKLCDSCASDRDRTWRLRWTPEDVDDGRKAA